MSTKNRATLVLHHSYILVNGNSKTLPLKQRINYAGQYLPNTVNMICFSSATSAPTLVNTPITTTKNVLEAFRSKVAFLFNIRFYKQLIIR